MRQFEVYALPQGTPDRQTFVVVLSSHHLSSLDTVIGAPLIPRLSLKPDGLLMLPVSVGEQDFTLAVPLLSGVEQRSLGRRVGDLTSEADLILRALDRLFTGF